MGANFHTEEVYVADRGAGEVDSVVGVGEQVEELDVVDNVVEKLGEVED